jgi:hypothetical protein
VLDGCWQTVYCSVVRSRTKATEFFSVFSFLQSGQPVTVWGNLHPLFCDDKGQARGGGSVLKNIYFFNIFRFLLPWSLHIIFLALRIRKIQLTHKETNIWSLPSTDNLPTALGISAKVNIYNPYWVFPPRHNSCLRRWQTAIKQSHWAVATSCD